MAKRSHADFCFFGKSPGHKILRHFSALSAFEKNLPIRNFKIYGALKQSVFTISINVKAS
jgi:hypothetical protein